MAEVKNIVPSFEEFEKAPAKYMGEINAQPAVDAAQSVEPAAQPGQTDSILGAQVGQATDQIPATAQPAAEAPAQPAPAEGVQPTAAPAPAAQPAKPAGGLV